MDPNEKFIIILLVQGAGFLSLFFRSYFSEKGKNKASREDSAKLTEIVETVKNELSHRQSVKSTVYLGKKDAALDFLKLSQDLYKFILETKNIPDKFSDQNFQDLKNSFSSKWDAMATSWLVLDIYLKSQDTHSIQLNWEYEIKNTFNVTLLYIDKAMTYYFYEKSSEDAIKKYSESKLDNRIPEIDKARSLEKQKYDSDYNNYTRIREEGITNLNKLNHQLLKQIAMIVRDEIQG